jgi:hypothetical protein
MTKQKLTEFVVENKHLKMTMKHTQVSELRVENELYKRELIRLRTLLELELERGMRGGDPVVPSK